jgi:LysW-gamma-L-lysine carboxypeptidase
VDDYPIRLLTDMLRIYSPSGEEEKISDFLLTEFKRIGFDSRKDDVGNIIGEFGHGSPTVLLCGHMDTIRGNLEVIREKEKVRGRGAVDAKSSLAAMIVGASKAKRVFSGKLLLLGVVDEEARGTGMKHFVQTNELDLDYAVIGEPSNTENIVIGYKGLLDLRLKCKTKTGHSAAPWRYDSAVDKAIEVWSLLKGGFPDSGERESRFHSVTGCLTGITGGDSTNVVPSNCVLTLDIRIPPSLNSSQLLANFRKKIGSYLNDNPNVTIDLEVIDRVEGYLSDSDSPLTRAFSYAVRRIRKKNSLFLKKTGTSDMNTLASKVKIPIIAYGPGDSSLDHTDEEQIRFKDYLDAIDIYVEALKRLAVIHGETSS